MTNLNVMDMSDASVPFHLAHAGELGNELFIRPIRQVGDADEPAGVHP